MRRIHVLIMFACLACGQPDKKLETSKLNSIENHDDSIRVFSSQIEMDTARIIKEANTSLQKFKRYISKRNVDSLILMIRFPLGCYFKDENDSLYADANKEQFIKYYDKIINEETVFFFSHSKVTFYKDGLSVIYDGKTKIVLGSLTQKLTQRKNRFEMGNTKTYIFNYIGDDLFLSIIRPM